MTRAATLLPALALAGLVWLTAAGTADAYAPRPHFTPRHMPGWDWWRTYPWSPYNYGRNPYNPIIVPGPYYYGYPYPYEYPMMTGPAAPAPATPPAAVTDPSAGLPTASGPLPSPPPGTAIIRVKVPDTWAQVSFNGVDSVTSGTDRTFVTPRLNTAGTSYTVSASWDRGGQLVRRQQVVGVLPGQTRVVQFAR